MKRYVFAPLLIGLFAASLASADTTYAGPTWGQINVDAQDSRIEIETGNLGLVVGGIANSSLEFELCYNFIVSETEKGFKTAIETTL